MFETQPGRPQALRRTALFLDYGADAQFCAEDGLEVSERGMCFTARWRFEIGTQLSLACVHQPPVLGPKRLQIEGVVVGCQPKSDFGERDFETTVFFPELSEETRESLREFPFQVAALF
jgi:hypothetical protein